MFETFEPLIRQNCGKIMAFAAVGVVSMAVGVVSMAVVAVKVVTALISGLVSIF